MARAACVRWYPRRPTCTEEAVAQANRSLVSLEVLRNGETQDMDTWTVEATDTDCIEIAEFFYEMYYIPWEVWSV